MVLFLIMSILLYKKNILSRFLQFLFSKYPVEKKNDTHSHLQTANE